VGVALLTIPALAVVAGAVGPFLPAEGGENVRILLPTLWLGFAATTTIAAATGGGRVLLPPDQRAPFPVSPAADHLGTVLLAPLNVAWLVQALGLVLAASWATGPRPAALAAVQVATLVWIVTVTVAGQAFGELVELVRTVRGGAWALRGLTVAVLVAVALVTATGRLVDALDASPLADVVAEVLATRFGAWTGWCAVVLATAVVTVAGFAAGVRLVALVQRRPARSQVQVESARYEPRPDPRTELGAALRIDHASLWRSTPLRRGLVALPVAPALGAAAARLDWYLVPLLPGLVTSGAALLFGVNAMSLDGTGAIWRSSLPGSARVWFTARLLVVAEICLVACALAVAVAALRAPGTPGVAEVVAVLCAALATTIQSVGHCAHWSVHRPYAATLRDARDQPAPPAAMAAYSARLAIVTTGTGLLLSTMARFDQTGGAVAVAVAVSALGLRRAVRAVDRWDRPAVRTRVVATVAGG
jgi:hypothetical protein